MEDWALDQKYLIIRARAHSQRDQHSFHLNKLKNAPNKSPFKYKKMFFLGIGL